MGTNITDKVQSAFKTTCDEYGRIFKTGFEPWANDERYSIHETNQVMNFMKSYKSIADDGCITWAELSVPYVTIDNNGVEHKKTNHLDGFIIDGYNVFFIEAKRFSRKNKKIDELGDDLSAIIDFGKDRAAKEQFMNRLPDKAKKQNYNFYCILLADVWNYRNKRKNETKRIDIDWKKIVKDYTNNNSGNITDLKRDIKEVYDSNYNLAYALFYLDCFKSLV